MAMVEIERGNGTERLVLHPCSDRPDSYQSAEAPHEPHDFSAQLRIRSAEGPEEVLCFAMHEPHEHGHDNLDDEAHARAHAADLPDYVSRGDRPSAWQIVTFGAAGGLIPCPASITVMLLALSVNATGLGLITVLAFSCGLAITLVGVGLAIVAGLSRLAQTGRFAAVTRHASLISAFVVLLSGAMALIMVH
jgi:nickel/cobalt exporter